MEVLISGTGFLFVNDLKCLFQGRQFAASFISNTKVGCNIIYDASLAHPMIHHPLDVSINGGKSWTNSGVSVVYFACSNEETPMCECQGKSDIVFVVDGSNSINREEWKNLQLFLYETTSHMCISEGFQHVSIVEFSYEQPGANAQCTYPNGEEYRLGEIKVNMTGDWSEVVKAAYTLERCSSFVNTPLHYGLELARTQLEWFGRENVPQYVVVITDGNTDSCLAGHGMGPMNLYRHYFEPDPMAACGMVLDGTSTNTGYDAELGIFKYWQYPQYCCVDDRVQKKLLENLGVQIFGIAVGNDDTYIDKEYALKNISTSPEFFASVNSFDDLQAILPNILDKTCLGIIAIEPQEVCPGKDVDIIVHGIGIQESVDTWCKVMSSSSRRKNAMEITLTIEAEVMSSNKINCTVPWNEIKEAVLSTSPDPYYMKIEIAQRNVDHMTHHDSRNKFSFLHKKHPDCNDENDVDLGWVVALAMIPLFVVFYLVIVVATTAFVVVMIGSPILLLGERRWCEKKVLDWYGLFEMLLSKKRTKRIDIEMNYDIIRD